MWHIRHVFPSGSVPYPFVWVLSIHPWHEAYTVIIPASEHVHNHVWTLLRRHLLNVYVAVSALFYLVWSRRRESDVSVTCRRGVAVLIVPWTTGDSSSNVLSCLCGDLWNRCLVTLLCTQRIVIECTVGAASQKTTFASRAHVLATGFYCQFYRVSSGCRSGVLHDGTCCRRRICLIDVLDVMPRFGVTTCPAI